MIKNLESKIVGSLAGMIASERAVNEDTPSSKEAIDIARLICQSATPEALLMKMPPSSWARSSSASVIGLVFHDRLGDMLDFCRTETLFSSPASQCAALGTAVLISSACFDVPMGIWPNEIGGILRGVDNYMVTLINDATVASMGPEIELDFFKRMNAKADPDTAILVLSLFSCLRGRTFDLACNVSKAAGPQVACLTGAVMGAAFPKPTDDPIIADLAKMLLARRIP